MLLNISLSHIRSLRVIRKLRYGFLFAFHGMCLYLVSFPTKTSYLPKIAAIFYTTLHLTLPLWGPRRNIVITFGIRKNYTMSQKMPQVRLAIALTYVHQLLQFLVHIICKDSKIGCRYNFLKYLAFNYFMMLWNDMTEMTRFPRHCYSVKGALCKHGF